MTTFISINCDGCNGRFEKDLRYYNRAIKLNAKMFCSRKCYEKTLLKDPIKKETERNIYIKNYRNANRESMKRKRHEYHKRVYGDEIKIRGKKYLRKWRAKKEYGEFWESAIIIFDIYKLLRDQRNAYE